MEKERVCVTGAGGFVASWVVKLLLSKDYVVHGTVRDPNDEKYAHLKNLEKASKNLKLFKADLLDYDSIQSAVDGCAGVFHVACPVPHGSILNPEVELLEPSVKGILNVLKACSEAKAKKVVYVSSVSAIMMNPGWPKDQDMDETCWSDKEFCRNTKNWYCLSKTEAEHKAFEYAKEKGLDVVSVCPGLVFGPILQSTTNTSSLVLIKLCQGSHLKIVSDTDDVPNRHRHLVDVRDVAEAVIMTYEKADARGRYLCVSHSIKTRDLVEKLRSLYPNYNYPQKFIETEEDLRLNSAKLQRFGWTYKPLDETLVDSIESYIEAGLLKWRGECDC